MIVSAICAQCEWRAQVTADTSLVFSGISTVGQVVSSGPFMLCMLGVASAIIYFLHARLQRWEHEVAVLRETADGERKFLVKKLRALHKRVQNEDESSDSFGAQSMRDIKDDLKELNDIKAEHYNGVGTMPTTASEYNEQHLATKDMTAKEQLSHRKKKREQRKQKRELVDRATTEQLLRRSPAVDE